MGILGTSLFTMLGLGGPIALALIYDCRLHRLRSVTINKFNLPFIFSFVNKYTLMAIPFFIYAGFLMERTGLIAKLFRLR